MGKIYTPLFDSAHVGPRVGLQIFFKLEMCHPTGSYKDRFVAALMPDFLARHVPACIATSSGNTGAALAAYCARYGITCSLFVNEFAPEGKLQQMRAYGARIFRVRDFVTDPETTERVFTRLRRISEESGIPIVVSAYRYCPAGMKGVENIARELVAQCRSEIQHVFVPVGGGGLFTAVCRGFRRLGTKTPRIHAVQPAGCDTVVSAFRKGRNTIEPVKSTTSISGLSVPFDIDGSIALEELRNCEGQGFTVTDAEVYEAQRCMLGEEGIWAEPAGATALAGCLKARRQGAISSNATTVCLVTGHGFKDAASLSGAVQENKNKIELIHESTIDDRLLEVSV